MKKRIAGIVALNLFLLKCPLLTWGADKLVKLNGHVSLQTQHAAMLAPASADESVPLSLMIHLDPQLLKQTLDQEYGSSAPELKHFLTTTEFAARFGLADKRQRIKNFARANGLTVDTLNDQPSSLIVNVTGSVSSVQNAFHVQLNHYRSRDGRLFRSHDTEPQVPASVVSELDAVLGLSDLPNILHPHLRMATSTKGHSAVQRSGTSALPSALLTGMTGPTGLAPADIKSVYGLSGTPLDGAGQSLALFELDGYTPSDIAVYATHFGLRQPTLIYIGTDGQTNVPGAGAGEVTLDIELALALAPGMSQILVYGGPNTGQGVVDTYDRIATDNTAKNVSTSWGLDEEDSGSSLLQAENTIFSRMAIQGQSVYAASGDCGAYDQQNGGNCITTNGFRVDDPASQPFVTGVGGTSLTGAVSSPSETTWNELALSNGASGGGVSTTWSINSTQAYYQIGLAGTASQQFRNVPDVSLNADPDTSPYAIYVGGGWDSVGGTSAAAPLWAALTALVNQGRVNGGKTVLGFANPTLYSLPQSTVFTDITIGNNGHYSAGPGYDNATGLGSFKGNALIAATANIAVPTIPVDQSSLSNVYAYPNPWDSRNPKNTQKKITFANLPDSATVKIFTLSGFWIKTLTPQGGQAIWDLTNNSGQDAASGLYLYLVDGGDIKVKGKIALIR